MRLIYVSCILLATTICCIATDSAVPAEGGNKINQEAKNVQTTAVPPTKISNPIVTTSSSISVINSASVDPTVASSTNASSTDTTSTVANSTFIDNSSSKMSTNNLNTTVNPHITTSHPMTPTEHITTKTKGETTTPYSVTSTTQKSASTVTSNPSSAVPPPATSAVPVSTKEAPPLPSKERHFDGLSFLGGIILATSLMAVGVLSWKFYRTFNERNYRTL